ncbi:MAG: transcription elongation factor GreA [Clostridium sp.]|jgi:transcription elongation factor GreA|uniref:transcription elongation factor GreA n=1 Tax=Clostridium sp. TaxID=1506 RepID=UPI0025BA4DF0|nr:transcription elongation factor GreA [Clostridium sp.]MCH3964242.1 transcription elongation factor GreA [Clostridium sp.]MCI1715422.1 transcription elongation factor GreA [Clostridium sp.]MCI1799787.1 transcription elongation factor GreA [Clostridium sp.]MCI1813605.1 transcription elongation factor GreA [Clostridium sp.]MCI1870604.1 transcription elongation factor GreA [Clostridium sp.]
MYNYLTKKAIDKLNQEIEHRKVIVRRKINEDLKEARAQGDLSENFEYKSAKRDRAHNESRIRYLEKMIKTAKIIEDTAADNEVGIGKTVYLKFEDEAEAEKFFIVTTIEADPLNNRISIESPLGSAIYRHTTGEKITVKSPDGIYSVTIQAIE